jgi:uncharacterized protein (TIGR00255 family)
MTGYGSSLAKSAEVELEVQIRSVNSRFLDLRFHLPREYLIFEADLKKAATRLVRRGCVDVFVQRRPNVEGRVVPVQFNKAQAKIWLESIASLKKVVGIKDPVQLKDVLNLPHVFEVNDRVGLDKQEESLLKRTFDSALKGCQKAREQEGDELQREILRLLGELSKISKKLEPWREKAQEKINERLQNKLKEINSEADPARLALETALQLDKMDIREEMVRLAEHVRACQNVAKASDVQGKRLDFYAQELLREVNTIGSKIQMTEVTELVVEAKTVIENFREQVQNVE